MDDKIYFGWDIGGANTKLAICNSKCEVIEFYFEVIPIWESTKPLEDFFHFVLNKFSGYLSSWFLKKVYILTIL